MGVYPKCLAYVLFLDAGKSADAAKKKKKNSTNNYIPFCFVGPNLLLFWPNSFKVEMRNR